MNVPSIDIKAMLDADLTVDSTSFPISRAVLNPDKSNCATILDVVGGRPQLTFDLARLDNLSIQIKVKAVDYDEGWLFINSVVTSLHGRANEPWGDTYYSLIRCLNGPGFLERDNQRSIFVANFNIQRRLL